MSETKKEPEKKDILEGLSPEDLEALAEKLKEKIGAEQGDTVDPADEERRQRLAVKAAENERMKELVPVTLFKDSDKYKDDLTVGLNGVMYKIQRGKTVMVPRAVAMIIEAQMEQDMATANLISQQSSEFEAESKRLGI